MPRVLVVGAGALGGLLAALAHEAGHDTFLVARRDGLRVLAEQGLLVEGDGYGPARHVRVAAGERAPEGFAPDVVIVATKTQDLDAALAQHADALRDAPVVALQNGLAQDSLVARACGPARAVAAIAALDAQMTQPGRVECARRGTLVMGPAFPEAADAARRAVALVGSFVDVVASPDIRGARWTKLLVNLGNVVPALTGLSFQEAARHAGLATAHVRMLREGLAVAHAEGVTLAPIPWTSPRLLRIAGALPLPIARRVYAARVQRVMGETPGYGSTWQSLQRGRSVETEWLNGEVVRRGRERGVATPVNAAAMHLLQEGGAREADAVARALNAP